MALLVSGYSLVAGYQQAGETQALDRLNAARARHRAEPLEANAQLDALAARYLDDMLMRRDLRPEGYGAIGIRLLSEDIAAAIGDEGHRFRYTGVVASYGENVGNAVAVATGTVSNGPALFEPAMTQVGIATAEVPAGEPWYAPPPGGVGRDIELEGMTIIVIVTAGEFRAPN